MCALSLNNLHILGYAVSVIALIRYFGHTMIVRSSENTHHGWFIGWRELKHLNSYFYELKKTKFDKTVLFS